MCRGWLPLALLLGRPAAAADPPAPPTSGDRGRWTYASEADAVRYGRIEAAADRGDPCAAGYFAACSENTDWFACSCRGADGGVEPGRLHHTLVLASGELYGRMWLSLGDAPPSAVAGHAAAWATISADAERRAGDGFARASVRIVAPAGKPTVWTVALRRGDDTWTGVYDGGGALLSEARDTFHPD